MSLILRDVRISAIYRVITHFLAQNLEIAKIAMIRSFRNWVRQTKAD